MATTDSGLQPTQKFELIDPDVRLMLEVKAGSAAAFEQLVARHQRRLILVLKQLVGDREQAEDLAQEVFLRIYRARESYTPTARFSTWLYRITHNVAQNSIRKKSRRREITLPPISKMDNEGVAMESLAKDKSSLMPTRIMAQQELQRVLEAAIQNLPARQRMATMLSRFEGMSYQEIADSMDLSMQAVKSLLSRARVNLKLALDPYLENGGQQAMITTDSEEPEDDATVAEKPAANPSRNKATEDQSEIEEEKR